MLKISKADRLYTSKGKEIRSFSHLKMDFSSENTFFVSFGPSRVSTRYLRANYIYSSTVQNTKAVRGNKKAICARKYNQQIDI